MEFIYTIISLVCFFVGLSVGIKLKSNKTLELNPAKAITNTITEIKKDNIKKKLEIKKTKEELEIIEGIQNILNYGN